MTSLIPKVGVTNPLTILPPSPTSLASPVYTQLQVGFFAISIVLGEQRRTQERGLIFHDCPGTIPSYQQVKLKQDPTP